MMYVRKLEELKPRDGGLAWLLRRLEAPIRSLFQTTSCLQPAYVCHPAILTAEG